MDLREKKTKRSIKNAFLELRAKKALEKITVKELTELAEISKATFYLHYHDIYELSEAIGQEIIDSVLMDISKPENIWENPSLFTRELATSFYAKQHMIDIIFSGSQSYVLPQRLEESIRAYLFHLRPELKENARFNIWLTYQIQGGFYAYRDNYATFGLNAVIDVISCMSEQMYADILS